MEANFNLGSLKIVQGPLFTYLKKTIISIDSNIEALQDRKVPTNFESLEYIKKLNGTFKMIGLNGVMKVLTLLNDGLLSIKETKFDANKSIIVLNTIKRNINSIIFYIENLLKGELDQPTKLYSEYEELALLLNKKVFFRDLFSPKLDFKNSVSQEIQNELRVGVFLNKDVRDNVLNFFTTKKSETEKIISSMLELISKEEYKESDGISIYHKNTRNLYNILEELQKLKISKSVYLSAQLQKLFLCISSPKFNPNFEKLILSDEALIKVNYSKIERTLIQLEKNINDLKLNDKTGVIKVDDEIIRDVLFFIINVLNKEENRELLDMPVYKELQELFDIDMYLNELKNTVVETSLIQRNPDLVNQIDKILVDLKEEFGLLVNKTNVKKDFVIQHVNKFTQVNHRVSDLLSSISSEKYKELSFTLNDLMNDYRDDKLNLEENMQKELSLAMVLFEYISEFFMHNLVKQKNLIVLDKQLELQIQRLELVKEAKFKELNLLELPKLISSEDVQDNKSIVIIFEKIYNDLRKTEEILNDFFREELEVEELNFVIKNLNSIKGIFSIVSKPILTQITVSIIKVWKQVQEQGLNLVEKKDLTDSVNYLSGILLFVESMKNNNMHGAEEMYENVVNLFNKNNTVEEKVPEFVPGAIVEQEVSQAVVEPIVEEKVSEFVPEAIVEQEVSQAVVESIVEEKVSEFVPEAIIEQAVPQTVAVNITKEYIDKSSDEDLIEVFLEEGEEVLSNIKDSINKIKKDKLTQEITNLRRYFHTLKGSGRMVGLDYMGEVAWMVEQTLNKILANEIIFSEQILKSIEDVKINFENWIVELKETKQAKVDLVKYKKIWLIYNPELTNKVIIEESVEIVEPISEVVAEPIVEEIVEPIAEVVAEPIVEEIVEPIAKVVAEPIVEEIVEPIAKVVAEPIVEEIVELIAEVVAEPIVEEIVEPIAEVVAEPIVEEIVEPIAEVVTEPIVEDEEFINLDELSKNAHEANLLLDNEFNNNEHSDNKVVVDFIAENSESDNESDNEEFIFINGKAISISLYNLYKEETQNHLKSMRKFIHGYKDFENGFIINEEFMRHSHTMCSISKSVNMLLLADLAGLLEKLSNYSIDKNEGFDKKAYNAIKVAVDNLDVFAAIKDGSLEFNGHYKMIMRELREIEKITIYQENVVNSLDLITQDDSEAKTKVDDILININNMLKSSFTELVSAIDKTQETKMQDVVKNISKTFTKEMLDLKNIIAENEKSFNERIENIELAHKESYNSLREDIKLLNFHLKKKI